MPQKILDKQAHSEIRPSSTSRGPGAAPWRAQATPAAAAASGGGMLGNMDDDGFSVGSASDGSIDLPGF